MSARCKSCGKELDWAVIVKDGEAGGLMPVNRDSAGVPGGNLAVWRKGDDLFCRALKRGEEPAGEEKWGMSHYADCPNAAAHRKRRASQRMDPGDVLDGYTGQILD